MEFSIEKPANLTPEHRRLLGQLAKVLRFRELFVNNTEYRAGGARSGAIAGCAPTGMPSSR